ncbi:hypothetical protein PENTCL1PPCAC_17277, partial [Pristionchus entomophagus]
NPVSSYRYIIQSQIFANLGAVSFLACVTVFNGQFSDTVLFHLEIMIDSIFHFASLCYVIVAIHRFVVIGQSFSEKKWTDGVPAVIVTTALIAIIKTYTVKLSNGSDDYTQARDKRSILTTILVFGCPLIQICVILSLDSISFKHLRFYNAQISDRIASNKNVEWRLLT